MRQFCNDSVNFQTPPDCSKSDNHLTFPPQKQRLVEEKPLLRKMPREPSVRAAKPNARGRFLKGILGDMKTPLNGVGESNLIVLMVKPLFGGEQSAGRSPQWAAASKRPKPALQVQEQQLH